MTARHPVASPRVGPWLSAILLPAAVACSAPQDPRPSVDATASPTSATTASAPLASASTPADAASAAPASTGAPAVAQDSVDGPLLNPDPSQMYWYQRTDRAGEARYPLHMVPIPGHAGLFHPTSSVGLDGLLLGGALAVDKDGLLAAPATLGQGMGKLVRFVRPKVGDHSEIATSLGKVTVDVVARETVKVPAGTFDAFKITIRSIDAHTIWLAPSVGLVRAEWPSRRVDELVARETAKPLVDANDCAKPLAKPLTFVSAAREFVADCELGTANGTTVYRALEVDAARPVWLWTMKRPSDMKGQVERLGAAVLDVPTRESITALAVSPLLDWRVLLK